MCASALSRLRHVAFAVFLGLVAIGTSLAGARAQSDPLPSWNDGAVKKSITDFVARVTAQGGADFVPAEQRIWYIIMALGFFQWMTIARLTRGEFLRLRNQEFVVAGVALGALARIPGLGELPVADDRPADRAGRTGGIHHRE